jgi:PAS domain S-box-containing protein
MNFNLPHDSFQFALENTVDMVVITDLNSVIQYANPAFYEGIGYSREEVLGKKPSMIRSQFTTQETYREMWETIHSGGWWRGEIINLKKSGELWYSYLSISQIRDANNIPIAYVGISRDITEMKKIQFRLKEASMEAIFMLSTACEAKDDVTGSHIIRVQHFSEAIALRLGLNPEEAEEIGYSSMMHDVGKLHVPDAILKKAGPLSDEEWKDMTRHTLDGLTILLDKPFYQVARDITANHHEKWDGTGYPNGKKREEIPLSARIVSVADVFDALTTERPYKKAWDEEQALLEVISLRGSAFDPLVVDAFLVLYEEGEIRKIRNRYL